MFKVKLSVYYRKRSKERGRLLEDLICHIEYDIKVAYDTTSLVLKQLFSKKLSIVPFVLVINGKPVTSYNMVYLLRFIYFIYFSDLKAFQILPQNKHKIATEAVVYKQ